MKTGTFVLSLWLALSTPMLAQGAEPDATVIISTNPCSFQTKHSFIGAKLQYWLSSVDGFRLSKEVTWNSDDKRQLRWPVQIPPGVYSYNVTGIVNSADFPCMSPGFFAVLPGSLRHINAPMAGGIYDLVVPLFIYGTEPPDAHAVIARFDGRPNCGSELSSLATHSIKINYDNVGYYAADDTYADKSDLVSPAARENVVFGITVQRPNEEPRVIRVVANYPLSVIASPPTAVRVDLTPKMLDAAFDHPPNALLCLTDLQ